MLNARSVVPVPPAPSDAAHGSPEAVQSLALSPDGSTLAVGDDTGTLQLWDTTRLSSPSAAPCRHPAGVFDTIAFSPDNSTLYASSAHAPLQRYAVDPARAIAQAALS